MAASSRRTAQWIIALMLLSLYIAACEAAQNEADQIGADELARQVQEAEDEAYEKGFDDGYEKGYTEGIEEAGAFEEPANEQESDDGAAEQDAAHGGEPDFADWEFFDDPGDPSDEGTPWEEEREWSSVEARLVESFDADESESLIAELVDRSSPPSEGFRYLLVLVEVTNTSEHLLDAAYGGPVVDWSAYGESEDFYRANRRCYVPPHPDGFDRNEGIQPGASAQYYLCFNMSESDARPEATRILDAWSDVDTLFDESGGIVESQPVKLSHD